VKLYLHSPNTSSWRGVQLKHRDNFTFTFTFVGGEVVGAWSSPLTSSSVEGIKNSWGFTVISVAHKSSWLDVQLCLFFVETAINCAVNFDLTD
jgi:hypothetical protein